MHKTTRHHKSKRANGSAIDLYGDLVAIKNALADATYDVKGKAGQILSESYSTIRDKSVDMKDEVSTFVSRKPMRSLGAMFIAGLAIGYVLRRK